jgi:hypothetical protein
MKTSLKKEKGIWVVFIKGHETLFLDYFRAIDYLWVNLKYHQPYPAL